MFFIQNNNFKLKFRVVLSLPDYFLDTNKVFSNTIVKIDLRGLLVVITSHRDDTKKK